MPTIIDIIVFQKNCRNVVIDNHLLLNPIDPKMDNSESNFGDINRLYFLNTNCQVRLKSLQKLHNFSFLAIIQILISFYCSFIHIRQSLPFVVYLTSPDYGCVGRHEHTVFEFFFALEKMIDVLDVLYRNILYLT